MQATSIIIDSETLARLQEYSRVTGTTVTAVIREALEEWLSVNGDLALALSGSAAKQAQKVVCIRRNL